MLGTHPLKYTLLGMIFFTGMALFRALFSYQYYSTTMVSFYNFVFVLLVLVEVYSIYSVFKYKKLGVYLFPIALFIEILLYLSFNTFLYFNLFGLFFYIGVGLLFIIPEWNRFKSWI